MGRAAGALHMGDKYFESEEFRTILQKYEEAVAQGQSPYLEPEELSDIAEYYEMLGNTIASADYIQPYSAAMHRDNFYACQFHPEKSGKVGEQILRNFLDIKQK